MVFFQKLKQRLAVMTTEGSSLSEASMGENLGETVPKFLSISPDSIPIYKCILLSEFALVILMRPNF